MAGRDMVIKSIENCLHEKECNDCSYEGCIHAHGNCIGDLMADALELLQEQQEPIKPYLDFDGHDVWRCGKCHTTIFHVYELTDIECEKKYAQYCRHCGRRVKWDDQKTQAETHQADHPLSGVLALEPDQHA